MITSKVLYIFWKIIGLCPFHWTKGMTIRFSYGGAFYSTLLSAFFTVAWLKTMWTIKHFFEFRTTTSAITNDTANTSELIMIVTIWLYVGFRQNDVRDIQKSFRKIAKTCETLGICEVHSKIISVLKRRVAILNCIWIIVFINDHIPQKHRSKFDYVLCAPVDLGRIVYPNFIIAFVSMIILLRDQFQSLNDKIRNSSFDDFSKIPIRNTKRRNHPNITEIEFLSEYRRLVAYVQFHSEMVDATESIVKFWSPLLYLAMATHLFQLGDLVYAISTIGRDLTLLSLQKGAFNVMACCWIVVHISGIIAEVFVLDSLAYEANRTGSILHEVLLSRQSRISLDSATMLSLRLLQKPLRIALLDMIEMNFEVVYRISNAVTTYVIIMIQLEDQDRDRNIVVKHTLNSAEQ